jgi:predicted  nucleic acid-binding Zn-ribbon protein
MMQAMVESALRALMMALAVWGGLRVFRVSNVVAQKAAWGLVLLCAAAVPALVRWQVLPASMAIKIPAMMRRHESTTGPSEVARVSPAEGMAAVPRAGLESTGKVKPSAGGRKPMAATARHRAKARDLARPLPARSAATDSAGKQTAASGSLPASSAGEAAIQVQPATEAFSDRMRGWAAVTLSVAGKLAAAMYLAVCLALLIRMAYGLNLAMTLWQAAEVFVPYPHDDPGYGLRMRFSRAVSSPVTIGSGVLLPYECLEWDARKLRIVLAHERAHIRQGDFYLQLLAGLYTAVFWFSPLGWWLKRKLTDLGEVISDRAGLDEAASAASYAQVLLEFAALPRPTAIGVAMARSTNLSTRIERLLNEASFRQAFAGGGRRVLLAVLLVPVSLFAATSLIRVEAAGQAQEVQPPTPAPSPAIAPSPASAPSPATSPDAAPAPAATPAPVLQSTDQVAPPPAAPDAPPPAIAPVAQAPAMPPMPSPDAEPAPGTEPVMPPMPSSSYYGEIHDSADDTARALAYAHAAEKYAQDAAAVIAYKSHAYGSSKGGYSYSYSNRNGDTMAIVTGNGNVSGSGMFGDHFSAVRKKVHGDFLYYEHEGHAYVIEDPALVAKAKALYAPIDELGRQQEVLGKKQEELGRQQEELGRKQEQASVPTPDISKEMAELNAAVAKLNAKKGGTVTEDDLADLEGKIGDIQGRLGELQGKMGERMGRVGEMQGRLGEEQGKLGEEQGRLGEQQGRLAEEADRKLKQMFEEGLHNGKARPVD